MYPIRLRWVMVLVLACFLAGSARSQEAEMVYKCKIKNSTGQSIHLSIRHSEFPNVNYEKEIGVDDSIITDPEQGGGLDEGERTVVAYAGHWQVANGQIKITGPTCIVLRPNGQVTAEHWPEGRGVSYPQLAQYARYAVRHQTEPIPQIQIQKNTNAISTNLDSILGSTTQNEGVILREAAIGLEALRGYANANPSRIAFWSGPIRSAEQRLIATLRDVQSSELNETQRINRAIRGRREAYHTLTSAINGYAVTTGKTVGSYSTKVTANMRTYKANIRPTDKAIAIMLKGDYTWWDLGLGPRPDWAHQNLHHGDDITGVYGRYIYVGYDGNNPPGIQHSSQNNSPYPRVDLLGPNGSEVMFRP